MTPDWAASTILRVYLSLMRLPTPKEPPVQPVFSRYTRVPWRFSFSPSNFAYAIGFSGMNAPPKHGEKFGTGSLMPRSVPATFAV